MIESAFLRIRSKTCRNYSQMVVSPCPRRSLGVGSKAGPSATQLEGFKEARGYSRNFFYYKRQEIKSELAYTQKGIYWFR